MKQQNARILDDLIHRQNGSKVYTFIRDAHVADLAEVLSALERGVSDAKTSEALVHFAWLMIEARDVRGSDESRKRDKLAAKVMAELKSQRSAQTIGTISAKRRA